MRWFGAFVLAAMFALAPDAAVARSHSSRSSRLDGARHQVPARSTYSSRRDPEQRRAFERSHPRPSLPWFVFQGLVQLHRLARGLVRAVGSRTDELVHRPGRTSPGALLRSPPWRSQASRAICDLRHPGGGGRNARRMVSQNYLFGVDPELPRRLSTADLVELTGLSRHQVYRMKRRLGWRGRWVYRGQLVRDLPELWDSIVLAQQLEQAAQGGPESPAAPRAPD